MSESAKQSRSHETRVEIDAPIEEVWKALVEADAITRWFAPNMAVEPGIGGCYVADWGPGLEWKSTIEVWEPCRHLRLVEIRDRVLSSAPADQPLEPCRLVQDFYLETEAGRTVLRLVHSGFGSSAAWDVEYEGTRDGWPGCLLRLKHGLEKHRNEPVHNLNFQVICHNTPWEEALNRIAAASPRSLQMALQNKYERCGVVPELNGALFSYSAQPAPGGSAAYVQMLLFGMQDAEAQVLEQEWRTTLSRMFPG